MVNKILSVTSITLVLALMGCGPQRSGAGGGGVVREDIFDPNTPVVIPPRGESTFALSHKEDVIALENAGHDGRVAQTPIYRLREIDLTSVIRFDARPGHETAVGEFDVSCGPEGAETAEAGRVTQKVILREPRDVPVASLIPGKFVVNFFAREDVPNGGGAFVDKPIVAGYCAVNAILKSRTGSSKTLPLYKYRLVYGGVHPQTTELVVDSSPVKWYQVLTPNELRKLNFNNQMVTAGGSVRLQCQSFASEMPTAAGVSPDFYSLFTMEFVNRTSSSSSSAKKRYTDTRATNPVQFCQLAYQHNGESILVSPIFGFSWADAGYLEYNVLQDTLIQLPYRAHGKTPFYRLQVTNRSKFPVQARVKKDTGKSFIAAGVFTELGKGLGFGSTIGVDQQHEILFDLEPLFGGLIKIVSENKDEVIIELADGASIMVNASVNSYNLYAYAYWFDGHQESANSLCALSKVFYDFMPQLEQFQISEVYSTSKKLFASGRVLLNPHKTVPGIGTKGYELNGGSRFPAYESSILADLKRERPGDHFSYLPANNPDLIRQSIKMRNVVNRPNSHNGPCASQ